MNERSAEYYYRDRVFQVDEEEEEGSTSDDDSVSMTPKTSSYFHHYHRYYDISPARPQSAVDQDSDNGSVCSRRSALKPPSQQRWTGAAAGSTNTSNTTNTTNTSSSRSVISTRSEVSFDSVGIREFPITLGDNPTALGPPVQLDYTRTEITKTMNLDHYEQERKRKPRRSMHQLRMSTRQRHVILREERKLSQEVINQAVLHAKEVRLQRLQTQSQSWIEQQLDEATESAQRKFSRCMPCAC